MSYEEQIIDALNRIEKALSSESWITILISVVGIICPIIMAIISYRLSKKNDESNEKLRKMLYNRDVENQTRGLYISIYNSFFGVYLEVVALKEFEKILMWNKDNSFLKSLGETVGKMIYYHNTFKLLNENNDNDIVIKKKMQSYVDICKDLLFEIDRYLKSPMYSQNMQNAYSAVSSYGIMPMNDYQLYYNNVAQNQFVSYLSDTYTEEIKKKIYTVCQNFEDGKYEEYFSEKAKIKRFQDIGD